MGFTESVKTVFSKFATFSGRASRSEFWWFYLFNSLAWLVFSVIGSIFGSIFGGGDAGGVLAGSGIGLVLSLIYSLVAIVPTISVLVRRLHDTGRSGWHYWWCLIPIAGPIILLVFLASPSVPMDNLYGPCPTDDLIAYKTIGDFSKVKQKNIRTDTALMANMI